jgi:hypothetical protein
MVGGDSRRQQQLFYISYKVIQQQQQQQGRGPGAGWLHFWPSRRRSPARLLPA